MGIVIKYWKYIVIATLATLLYFSNVANDNLKIDNKLLDNKISELRSKLESTVEGVNLCNSRVDALIASSDGLINRLSDAQINAAKIRDNSNITIQNLIKQNVPKDCDGAFDWTYEQAHKSVKDWK